MPRFSAFSAFGHLRFSQKPPLSQQLYLQMVANLGSGENFSDDFDSIVAARLYANAMAMGRAAGTLERAGNQWQPDRALEGLPTLEREVSRIPDIDETLDERRKQVAARLKIPRGASYPNVVRVFRDVLGDGFVSYEVTPIGSAVLHPTDPAPGGVYVTPGSRKGLFRLATSYLFPGVNVELEYERVSGDSLREGDKILVDLADSDRMEVMSASSLREEGGRLYFQTQGQRAHQAGTQFLVGRSPTQVSSKRHSLIFVSENVIQSSRLLRIAHETASRVFRGVSTWSICSDLGPFRVGVGRLGVTAIGEGS